MRLDERIVINIPKSVQGSTTRTRNAWVRRAVLRALWEVRNRRLVEGYDILNVFTMTDCVEVNIKGDLEAMPISDEKRYSIRGMIRQRKERKEEDV